MSSYELTACLLPFFLDHFLKCCIILSQRQMCPSKFHIYAIYSGAYMWMHMHLCAIYKPYYHEYHTHILQTTFHVISIHDLTNMTITLQMQVKLFSFHIGMKIQNQYTYVLKHNQSHHLLHKLLSYMCQNEYAC